MIILFVIFLHLIWIGVWLFQQFLASSTAIFADQHSLELYWLLAKLLFWLTPTLLLINTSKNTLRKLVGFFPLKRLLKWGIGGGLFFALLNVVPRLLSSDPVFNLSLNYAFFSAVIAAPVIEELAFRGAILPVLKEKYGFWIANSLTALFFTTIHMPGWYFQGKLLTMLTAPVGGALFIFFAGWVFGWIAHRSKSVGAGTLAHMINNFFSRL